MIIKKITIENYLCYYGIKEFELSDGLNIILGENGEGKTKLFEAIEWLLNGDNRNLNLLVSAKAIAEAEINETFRTRVSLNFERHGETRIVIKSFLAKKRSDGDIEISNYSVEGIEENKAGERVQTDGKNLLDYVFPPELRRYSMFKGEEQLNVFANDEALGILIKSFSRSKYFDKYVEKGAFLREKAEKAVDEAAKRDKNSELAYKRLEADILKKENERHRLKVFIDSLNEEIEKLEANIQEAEKYVDNAEALETINNRIKNLEALINKKEASIDENYTTSLFDENWILVNFLPIHKEFAKKVELLSKRRRELQSEFDKERGIREGKKQMQEEILHNVIPLPIGVPSKAHMEEMIKDKVCKVCNTPALEGSPAYKFMLTRLEEYLKSQEPIKTEEDEEEEEKKVLFKHEYIQRLFNLSVSHEDNLASLKQVKTKIKDWFDFNNDRKLELEELRGKLEKELEERKKVVGSSSLEAEKLTSVLKSYNGWQKDAVARQKESKDYLSDLAEIEETLKTLKEEKDKIDIKTANTFLINTRSILRDIETIFKDTKERKFDEFISLLQDRSNRIFEKINPEAFTGTIVFKKKGEKSKVHIELQEDGKIFYKPNQSLATSMHIAILFAISELASEYREEGYPMIFDAPTSSFGETKTAEFLNLIYETGNQKILLLKDFLAIDEKSKQLSVKQSFGNVKRHKAFWVRLQRPFNNKVLKTLNTEVVNL
jgi:DNA sulfur modification protein DndD